MESFLADFSELFINTLGMAFGFVAGLFFTLTAPAWLSYVFFKILGITTELLLTLFFMSSMLYFIMPFMTDVVSEMNSGLVSLGGNLGDFGIITLSLLTRYGIFENLQFVFVFYVQVFILRLGLRVFKI